MSKKLERIAVYALSALAVCLASRVLAPLSIAPQLAAVYVCVAFFTVAGLDRRRMHRANRQELAFAPVWRPRGVYLDNGLIQVAPIGEYILEERLVAVNGFTFEDRCLGYLFAAPLMLPAELYLLARGQR